MDGFGAPAVGAKLVAKLGRGDGITGIDVSVEYLWIGYFNICKIGKSSVDAAFICVLITHVGLRGDLLPLGRIHM